MIDHKTNQLYVKCILRDVFCDFGRVIVAHYYVGLTIGTQLTVVKSRMNHYESVVYKMDAPQHLSIETQS